MVRGEGTLYLSRFRHLGGGFFDASREVLFSKIWHGRGDIISLCLERGALYQEAGEAKWIVGATYCLCAG